MEALIHTLLEFRPITCLIKNGGPVVFTSRDPLAVTCEDCKKAIL